MSELELGTPAASTAAPASDDAGLSPTFDAGTQTTDSGPDASTGTDEEKTLLQERVAELEKRVSNGTRTTQELQQAKRKLEAYESRLEKLKKGGVDLDEVERIIDTSMPHLAAPAVQPQGEPDRKYMTAEEYEQRRVLDKWEDLKDAYFEKNPDLDDEDARDWFDVRVKKLAAKEYSQLNQIVTSPKGFLKKVAAEFNTYQSKLEKRIEKRLTEKRTQVGAQGVIETAHTKVKVDRTDENTPKTPQERAAAFRARQQKIQRGG